MDETGELTEAENGSIMSVGRLTYDFLERAEIDSTSIKGKELYTRNKT